MATYTVNLSFFGADAQAVNQAAQYTTHYIADSEDLATTLGLAVAAMDDFVQATFADTDGAGMWGYFTDALQDGGMWEAFCDDTWQGEGAEYGDVVKDLTSTLNYVYSVSNNTAAVWALDGYTLTLMICLDADASTYTVTFDANGGTCDEVSRDYYVPQNIQGDTYYGELPIATKTGSTFLGWEVSE